MLEIPKLHLSVALVLTLSNLHYKHSHIFCLWKASGINCVCDLSIISNLLSIISSPRGLDYTNLVWKPEKNPRVFIFPAWYKLYIRAISGQNICLIISGSLVFQVLCTSPEALLNLEIIVVIIIYSSYCHNNLDSQAPFLLGTVEEKHKTPPTRIPSPSVVRSLQDTVVS